MNRSPRAVVPIAFFLFHFSGSQVLISEISFIIGQLTNHDSVNLSKKKTTSDRKPQRVIPFRATPRS